MFNTQWFLSIEDAQQQLNMWRQEYNVSRPHRTLHDCTPPILSVFTEEEIYKRLVQSLEMGKENLVQMG